MVQGTELITRKYIDHSNGEEYEVEISLRDAMLFDLLLQIGRNK